MKKGHALLQICGGVCLLTGVVLQITRWEFSPYLYTLGAILFAWVQVVGGYDGKNLVIRRLRRQQMLSAVLLVFTGVLMLTTRRNEWIVCLTIAAVLQLYTAFRIPSEMEKEQ